MANVVTTDVNKYGYVHGGIDDDQTRASLRRHGWTEPFPTIPGVLTLGRVKGTSRVAPNVLHHNLVPDFACDLPTFEFLHEKTHGAFQVVARGRAGDLEVVLLQVVGVLDVVEALVSDLRRGPVHVDNLLVGGSTPVSGHYYSSGAEELYRRGVRMMGLAPTQQYRFD